MQKNITLDTIHRRLGSIHLAWHVTFSGIYSCSFTPYVVNLYALYPDACIASSLSCVGRFGLAKLLYRIDMLLNRLDSINAGAVTFPSDIVFSITRLNAHKRPETAKQTVLVNDVVLSPMSNFSTFKILHHKPSYCDQFLFMIVWDSSHAFQLPVERIVTNIHGDTGECKATLILGCAPGVVIVLLRACYYIDDVAWSATLDVRDKALASEEYLP
ncbi:uncharacterized protein F5147DRAFT_658992 [Suillus discolor]|uniref:Uncharacterized protein n=1 Tax=Suillus discolor TaxID=1912936 RepID=A0A9P7JM58_9AGAM|nr:uncharacterized protein F5147DRAFT_658992 [Suillus discolor]KAG2087381.1 hypothetical protein F5147DRAFT_658992 [Suillus discolor]